MAVILSKTKMSEHHNYDSDENRENENENPNEDANAGPNNEMYQHTHSPHGGLLTIDEQLAPSSNENSAGITGVSSWFRSREPGTL